MTKPKTIPANTLHGPCPELPRDVGPYAYVRNTRAGWIEVPWQTNPDLVARLVDLGGKPTAEGWAFGDPESLALARAAINDDAKQRGNLRTETLAFAPGLNRIGRERWAALSGRLGAVERHLELVDVKKVETKAMLAHVKATGIDKTLAGLLELDLADAVLKAIHKQRRELGRTERSEAA